MRKGIIVVVILFFGNTLITFGQLQVYTVNVATNDLVYDAITNRIYASVPSSNGSNGNSIGVINPDTYLLENTIFIGSEPTVMAISDNGQYIYSGFSGSSTVRIFDVSNQTAGIQFSLGNDVSTGPYYVEDIEVMPGQPTTIAISRKNSGFSPRHEGVVIYDYNVMRPTETPGHTGSNRIEFTSHDSLIGYNNETTEYGIRKLSVDTNGVSNVSVTQSVLSNFNLDFIYRNNYMYSTDGVVVDLTAVPFVIGQFSNVNGPVVYDENYNKICYASYDFSGNITFKRFNPNTFLVTDVFPITQGSGPVKSLITCGDGCYAFNTDDDKVIILKDLALSLPGSVLTNKIRIYPNPTSDFVNIRSDIEIKEIEISDLNGRVVDDISFVRNQLDLGKLAQGLYLAKIVHLDGSNSIEKIIKN